MKRFFALLLAMAMVFSLAACGGDEEPAPGGSGEPTATQQQQQNDPPSGGSQSAVDEWTQHAAYTGGLPRPDFIKDTGAIEMRIGEEACVRFFGKDGTTIEDMKTYLSALEDDTYTLYISADTDAMFTGHLERQDGSMKIEFLYNGGAGQLTIYP